MLQSNEHSDRDQHATLAMNGTRHPHCANCSASEDAGGNEEYEVREDDAGRQSHRDDAAEQIRAVPLRRVLHRHQHGAAPFTAERKALDEAERRQQAGAHAPNLGVGR